MLTTLNESDGYWCECAAFTDQRPILLGCRQTGTPRLALRWLRGQALRIAEQLDASAALPVQEWYGSAVEHETELRVLIAGDLYAVTTYDDEARYVLSARPMRTVSFLEWWNDVDPEVLQAA